MKKCVATFICSLYIICGMHGAVSASGVRIWAVGDCHKINPVTGQDFNPFVVKDIAKKNYIWDSQTNTVTLFGAKNEYVSFQIIIEAMAGDLNGVNVAFSDLNGPGTIAAKNIKLFKEFYTPVWKKSDWPQPSTGPGEYPDALIPFEVPKFGAPFSIKNGRNQAVWADIFIPKDCEAGSYTGSFSVSSGAKNIRDIKVALTVLNFTLPDKKHLICWSNYYQIKSAYGFKADDERYQNIEKSIWKVSHAHRLNALLRHAHIRPKAGYGRSGQLIMDFQPYEEKLTAYLDGSIFDDKLPPDIFLLPISGGTEYRWPRRGPESDPDSGFVAACKNFASYFREKSWNLDKCYIYLSDEPKPEEIDKVIRDAKLIHDADKDLKTMVALHKAFNADTLQKLAGSVDMWLIDGAHYDSKLLKPRQRVGEKAGFYQQGEPWCGNENLDSDSLGLVTWPWIAWKYGADCIYLYSMTEWHSGSGQYSIWQRARNKTWSNSQGVLIYPGNFIGIEEVVPSIRLKEIRRGMQDYEYMYLARAKGRNPDAIVNSIMVRALDEADRPEGTYGEWSHNPEDWFLARQNLARLILGEELLPMASVTIPPVRMLSVQSEKSKDAPNRIKEVLLNFGQKIKSLKQVFSEKIRAFRQRNAKKDEISTANTAEKDNPPPQPSGPIRITIYPEMEKGKISRLLYGSNLCAKMESDRPIWDFVKGRGITCFRFPGGGSPGWHWKTGMGDFNAKMQDMPLAKIDYLVKFCQKTNTVLIMQVNVESGTPQEAAELVEYMNKIANFRVDYWELGNEVYGDWDKGYTTPDKYAQLIKEYSEAMKAVDPTIKIGADWGERYYDKVKWDETVIKLAADYIDFVSVHWYPNHTNRTHPHQKRTHPTPEEVMANAAEIPSIVNRVNRLIGTYAPHRKGKIEVTFLEWDGSWDAPSSDPTPPYAQGAAIWSLANAIFYADCLGQFAENGVTASAHYNLQECMFGLIRGWDPSEGWGGMKWDTEIIRPKAFAIELFSRHFGDTLIESKVENSPTYIKEEDWWPSSYTGNVSYITCYASKFSQSGKLGIIMVNKHPNQSFDITISMDGASISNTADLWTLNGPNIMVQNDNQPESIKIEKSEMSNISNNFTYTLPAHSIVAMEIGLL